MIALPSRAWWALALTVLLLIGALATSVRADEEGGNLPAGTTITVSIDGPAESTLVADPPGGVAVSGTASVGQGVPVKDTTLVFVMDVSGSMGDSAGVDCDGAPGTDSRLTCEKVGVAIANAAAADTMSTVDLVGLASFANGGAAHDVNLGLPGVQLLVPPNLDSDADGTPDLVEAALSLPEPGRDVTMTNYGAGLNSAFAIINSGANTNGFNRIVFMSDGKNNLGPSVNTLASPSGVNIRSFALGTGVNCTSDQTNLGSLNDVAALSTAGTGTCVQVTDLSKLADAIDAAAGSTLDALTLSVDGGPGVVLTNAQISPDLPAAGPVSVTYATSVSGLAPGTHSICVRASGTDGGGAGSVQDCHQVVVAGITLAPSTSTIELGTPGQDHTVTATVTAGAAGGIDGIGVTFSVLSGPNAGAAGAGVTDGAGEAAFTYVATQGPSGLGIDAIRACFVDDLGNEACADATAEWVDTTPPDVACTPSVNPGGKEPRAGDRSPGQNEDGFYLLTATDAVDPDPEVYLVDDGSGTVFGPFPSGTNIKYTQAPGATPRQRTIGGPNSEVDWHITGNGDAAVYGVDDSGNVSDPVACLVPPPPK